MNQPNWATYIGGDQHEGIYEPGKKKKKGKTKLGLITYRSCISGMATIYK